MKGTITYAPVSLTEKAAEIVKTVMEKKGKPEAALRLFIVQGGCCGFQYGLGITEEVSEDDAVFESHSVRIVVDPISLQFVQGAVIDYEDDDLMGGGFRVDNPNAMTECECGHSFKAPGAPPGTPCCGSR
ncbi:MAG: iron-sulfur cluster insertion protein ErpA [Armatimonadota bacterium]